jgi:serine protease AprX
MPIRQGAAMTRARRATFLKSAVLLAWPVVALLALAGTPAGAASNADQAAQAAAPAAQRPTLADRDGDGLADTLGARLVGAGPDERLDVVVLMSGAGGGRAAAAAAQALVGAFDVRREFTIIDGFAATMSAAQVRALARAQGVLRVEDDFTVRTQMNLARADFGADAARTTYTVDGAGIGICVVDTGVDPGHEQLDNGKVVLFNDFVNNQTPAYDDHGHGTHVASMAAGDGTGGASAATYRGVAPGASIYAAKVLNSGGSGSDSNVVAGVDWCAQQPGVRIISLSLGSDAASDGSDALSQAVNAAVTNHGKVVVAAAGNSGDDNGSVGSPAAALQAIAAGAVAEHSGTAGAGNTSLGVYLAPFSSRGPTGDGRIKPEIAAPGVSITAAKKGTTDGYITYSGTSMATPFTSGAIALALDRNENLTPGEVRALIACTAADRGPAGQDNDWGHGLIDVKALVAKADDPTCATAPTADQRTSFPQRVFVSDSVPNNGARTHYVDVAAGDLGKPLAVTMIIAGQAKCALQFGNLCWAFEYSPDLDIELHDPDNVPVAESTCMAGLDCGAVGRQETLYYRLSKAGTYQLIVYAVQDSVNNGKGGPYSLDISWGALGATSEPPPDPPPATEMRVSSLTGSKSSLKGGWIATATIGIVSGGTPVVGVLVTGNWSGGYSASGVTCMTNSSGFCSVSTAKMSNKKTSATFTITAATKDGYILTDGAGDSVTITK